MSRHPADLQEMIQQGIEARDVVMRALDGCRSDIALLALTEAVAVVIATAFMDHPAKAMQAAAAFSTSLTDMVASALRPADGEALQ